MQIKHIISMYSDEFEQKVNVALGELESKGKTIKELKYLFTDRYFTVVIIFN